MDERPEFAEFYSNSFAVLCGQLQAYTGDLTEAQDIVQEAFCRAFMRWDKISRYDDPAAWVRKVAWNLAASRWRKLRSHVLFAQKHREEYAPEPSGDRLDLAAALRTLPERQRQAVVLHYLSDIPIAEIATLTGAAEGTVKSWLHRARSTLDAQLRLAQVQTVPVNIPGVEAVRKTARRRRDHRTIATVIILILLAATAIALPFALPKQPPVIPPVPSPSVSPSVSQSPSPVAAGEVPVVTPAAATCSSEPVGKLAEPVTGTSARVTWMDRRTENRSVPMCPGVRLTLKWASYSLDSSLNATLYKTGSVTLDNNTTSATMTVEPPPGCADWYITKSDVAVPQYMDARWRNTSDAGSPFWDARVGKSILFQHFEYSCPSSSPSTSPSP